MATMAANEAKDEQKAVDYSKLDVYNVKDQVILHEHLGNYDINHMNWKQIEYDALCEGNIIYTYETIKKWMNHFESNNNNSNNNNNNSKKEEYLKEKSKYESLIDNITNHFYNLQNGYSQLYPEKSNILTKSHMNLTETTKINKEKEDSWITQVDNHKGISVFYRKEKNTPIHSIKVSLTCKSSPLEFLATINEFDLLAEVITIVPLECRFLKEYSDCEKVLFSKMKMWWPLADRDVVAKVFAYDCLKYHDSVVIIGSSPTDDTTNNKNNNNNNSNSNNKNKSEEKENSNNNNNNNNNKNNSINDAELQKLIPPVGNNTVRMEVTWALGEIKVIKFDANNSQNCEIEIISVFNVDFKSFLPTKIINWFSRTFAYYACLMIRNKCETIYQSKTHVKRINERVVYQRIKDRLISWNDERNKQEKEKGKGKNDDIKQKS